MRADDYSEHYDSEGRPRMRRHSLNRVTCDWAIEHGLQDHPMAVAAAVAATNIQSGKVSSTQKAALLSEWRRCMEALGSELVEEHPTVTEARRIVDEYFDPDDAVVMTSGEAAILDLVLRPGSPWR